MMKKKIVILGITVMLFICGFSGCTEQNDNDDNKQDSDETIITDSVESFSLISEDLPNGYRANEYQNIKIQNIDPIDSFGMHFTYEDPINDTGYPFVGIYLYRFSNSNQASQSMQTINNEYTSSLDQTKKSSIPLNEEFGEETIFKLYIGIEGKNYKNDNITFSSIQFRIKNVIAYIFFEGISTDYIQMINITTNYAEIVENRILEREN